MKGLKIIALFGLCVAYTTMSYAQADTTNIFDSSTPCKSCPFVIIVKQKVDSTKSKQDFNELRAIQKSEQKSRLNNKYREEILKAIKSKETKTPENTEKKEKKDASQIKYEILYREWREKLKASARTQ